MKIIALLVVLLICSVGVGSAANYYVSTTGNNASDGLTIGTAWANVSYGTLQLTAGDTLKLIDGVWYNETCTFSSSGNTTHPVTVTTHNGTPTLQGDTSLVAFDVSGKSYITIENIKLNDYYMGVKAYSSSNVYKNRISNNTFESTEWGMWLVRIGTGRHIYNFTIDNNTLLNNTKTDNLKDAIKIVGAENITIEYNTIDTTITGNGIEFDNVGNSTISNNKIDNVLYKSITALASNDIIVISNNISNAGEVAIRFDYSQTNISIFLNYIINGGGIYIYPNNENVNISSNYINNSLITVNGMRDSVINNNTIINGTFEVDASAVNIANNLKFESNIIKSSTTMFRFLHNSTFQNNVIYNSIYGIRFGYNGISTVVKNFTIKNNVFYNLTSNAIHIGESSGNSTATISNNIFMNVTEYAIWNNTGKEIDVLYNNIWNNGTNAYYNISTDISSTFENPFFYNLSIFDFHLNSTAGTWNGTGWEIMNQDSPCIDDGNPSDDYSNEPSPNGNRINIGAYGNTIYASKTTTTDIETFVVAAGAFAAVVIAGAAVVSRRVRRRARGFWNSRIRRR